MAKQPDEHILKQIVIDLKHKGYEIQSYKYLGKKGNYIRFAKPLQENINLPIGWEYSKVFNLLYTERTGVTCCKDLAKWANGLGEYVEPSSREISYSMCEEEYDSIWYYAK